MDVSEETAGISSGDRIAFAYESVHTGTLVEHTADVLEVEESFLDLRLGDGRYWRLSGETVYGVNGADAGELLEVRGPLPDDDKDDHVTSMRKEAMGRAARSIAARHSEEVNRGESDSG